MSPEEYLVVEARIKKEQENLLALEKELARYGLYPEIKATAVGGFPLEDPAATRIIGSILHDYYTALEKIFEVVAGKIDRSVPAGETWHKELLEQMSLEIPGLRPALLAPATAAQLDPYRGFRHVFRNVYGFNLSPARVLELLRALPAAAQALHGDLDCFASRMRILLGLER